MQEVALSLPFTLSPYGNITVAIDQPKIWADRVRAVLGTTLRERLMRPTFGSLLTSAFMETNTVATATILGEVSRAFSSFLPGLTLNAVDTSVDEYTGEVTATINYSLPNNNIIDTTISVAYIVGNIPPYEENK